MRKIDSDALVTVQKQLGQSGQGEPSTTLLDDELLQSFDTVAAVRPGRSDVGTGGWFYGRIKNQHVGTDTVFSFFDAYAPDNVSGSYPAAVGRDFDVWLGHVWAFGNVAGFANFGSALAALGLPGRMQGPSSDKNGFGVTPSDIGIQLAWWDEQVDISTVESLRNSKTLESSYKVGMRLPRGAGIQFMTETTGAGTPQFTLIAELGVFPIGLGQDIGY